MVAAQRPEAGAGSVAAAKGYTGIFWSEVIVLHLQCSGASVRAHRSVP